MKLTPTQRTLLTALTEPDTAVVSYTHPTREPFHRLIGPSHYDLLPERSFLEIRPFLATEKTEPSRNQLIRTKRVLNERGKAVLI